MGRGVRVGVFVGVALGVLVVVGVFVKVGSTVSVGVIVAVKVGVEEDKISTLDWAIVAQDFNTASSGSSSKSFQSFKATTGRPKVSAACA